MSATLTKPRQQRKIKILEFGIEKHGVNSFGPYGTQVFNRYAEIARGPRHIVYFGVSPNLDSENKVYRLGKGKLIQIFRRGVIQDHNLKLQEDSIDEIHMHFTWLIRARKEDIIKILEDFEKILKPGGKIYISGHYMGPEGKKKIFMKTFEGYSGEYKDLDQIDCFKILFNKLKLRSFISQGLDPRMFKGAKDSLPARYLVAGNRKVTIKTPEGNLILNRLTGTIDGIHNPIKVPLQVSNGSFGDTEKERYRKLLANFTNYGHIGYFMILESRKPKTGAKK